MANNLIITIGRQYGSGGREIGCRLALALGIPFYDRELITRAAKQTGVSEEIFDQLDKRATNSLLYSLAMFGGTGLSGMSLSDQLFLAQTNVIREIANTGPAVLVGRCADHVLREENNRFDFFITGSLENRLQRIATSDEYPELNSKNPSAALEKMDKQRATYYNYYTGKTWGKCDSYDLCINAGRLGIDASVDIIMKYVDALKA